MKIVAQRVTDASVSVDGKVIGAIDQGYMVLVGVGQKDTAIEAAKLAKKLAKLRVFSDENGKMNRSVLDVGGSILSISQFTLYADTTQGNRPGFTLAGPQTWPSNCTSRSTRSCAVSVCPLKRASSVPTWR